MLKASLKIKAVASAIATTCALLASSQAHAFAYASEPTQLANNLQLQSANTQLIQANSLLKLVVTYMGNVPGTTLSGELADILGQLKMNAQYESNNVQEAAMRARMKDAQERYYKAEMQAMPTVQQCQDITQGSARGGAGGAGAKAAKTAAATAVDTALTAKSDAGSAGRIVSNRSANSTCSADDAAHGRTGCGSMGTMPSADANAATFFQSMTADGGITQSNLSFAPQQQQLIANSSTKDTLAGHLVTPFPAPVLSDSVEKTPQGLSFLALKLASSLRLSTASYALAQIAGLRTPDSAGQFSGTRQLSGGTGTAWNNGTVQTIYQRMFPQDKFPTAPSQAEILRYEVASRYVDMGDGSWMLKVATMNPEDMQKEQLKLQALQAYMQWLEYQRLEEGNAMLASLVAQSQYPITNQTLQAASQSALGNQR